MRQLPGAPSCMFLHMFQMEKSIKVTEDMSSLFSAGEVCRYSLPGCWWLVAQVGETGLASPLPPTGWPLAAEPFAYPPPKLQQLWWQQPALSRPGLLLPFLLLGPPVPLRAQRRWTWGACRSSHPRQSACATCGAPEALGGGSRAREHLSGSPIVGPSLPALRCRERGGMSKSTAQTKKPPPRQTVSRDRNALQ